MTTSRDTEHLLSTRQMAQFVTNGFLRFEGIVPDDLNAHAIDEMRRLSVERFAHDGLKPPHTGTPLDWRCWSGPAS